MSDKKHLEDSPKQKSHSKKETFMTENKHQQPHEETEEERQARMRKEEEERNRIEEEEKVRKRQEQALMFEKYLDESGLSLAFQIIFTELIQKQIAED